MQPGEFKVYGSSEVTLAVGENEKIIEGLVLYPNPAKGNFVLNKTVQNIEIYDLLGRKVKSFSGNFNSFRSFDVSSLKASIYLVKIRSDFGTSTRRLVIE